MRAEFIDDIVQDLSEVELFYDNYGPFAEFAKNKSMVFDIRYLNRETYSITYTGILNLMKDTIETEYMTDHFITVKFDENNSCDLAVPDLWVNIIMWYIIVITGRTVRPCHLFFEQCITKKNIKSYIDNFLIKEYTTSIDIIDLNNIIDDCIHKLLDINMFSMFLANTINLEDFVILMESDPEFDKCIHANIGSDVPLDQVKAIGMEYTNKAIERIRKSKHGLANFFRAQEGINIKQFKEVAINIGTKPDGQGGIFPTIVNSNFLIGGVSDILSFEIESHNGRFAQIIVDGNVSDSGYFARLLGVNNIDTIIHPDPHFDCHTRNFVPRTITKKGLKMYDQRYYRLHPEGMEYILQETDTHLIGKTIYLRSPMTCKSHAEGKGICYKCYGRLAYIIKLINAGKIAAELMSSVLTQKMLSAKHLLEAAVQSLTWSKEFPNIFFVEFNNIKLKPDFDPTGMKLIINANEISANNEDEIGEMNESVLSFKIEYPNGERITMTTAELSEMYITIDLNNMIRAYAKANSEDEEIVLDMSKLVDKPIFSIDILNNDLNKTLNKIKSTINSKDITEKMTMGQILETLLDNLDEGGLNLNSVHAEVILSNQIRNANNIMLKPNWDNPNERYQILTLKGSLKNSPSISVRLAYEGIKAALYNPLTFKCNKTSFLDLFFVPKPQEYLSSTENIVETSFGDKDENNREIYMKRIK